MVVFIYHAFKQYFINGVPSGFPGGLRVFLSYVCIHPFLLCDHFALL